MANTKLSQRIKYAMEHLSHKQYISLLARPNWRRIQRMDMNTAANPFGTRRTALKARASRRIKAMARPKHVNRKYDPGLLLSNMRFPTSGNIAETLWKVQNSRYKRYRFFCNARQQREIKKKRNETLSAQDLLPWLPNAAIKLCVELANSWQTRVPWIEKIMTKLRRAIKPDEWNQHLEVLDRLATPKVPPEPSYPDRKRKWRPVSMKRIDELSSPVVRETPSVRDPFTVPSSALTYNITKRVNKISLPKSRPGTEPPKIPGEVSPGALRAVASPRTIILAKPLERPQGVETGLREDAFTVSPKALKAKCSRRLKLLARHKTRR